MIKKPRCEVCGMEANCVVRDIVSKVEPKDGYAVFEPDGEAHFFCIKHDRDSQMRKEKPWRKKH